MKFHKQLILHDPENGKWGDCFRTAIACLLDLDPEQVPHFADNGNDMTKVADRWLGERGLVRLVFGLWPNLETTFLAMKTWNKGIPYLLVGQSPRGTSHVVLALNDEIIWDPHPEGGDLVGPDQETGVYWLQFIVRTADLNAAGEEAA